MQGAAGAVESLGAHAGPGGGGNGVLQFLGEGAAMAPPPVALLMTAVLTTRYDKPPDGPVARGGGGGGGGGGDYWCAPTESATPTRRLPVYIFRLSLGASASCSSIDAV